MIQIGIAHRTARERSHGIRVPLGSALRGVSVGGRRIPWEKLVLSLDDTAELVSQAIELDGVEVRIVVMCGCGESELHSETGRMEG